MLQKAGLLLRAESLGSPATISTRTAAGDIDLDGKKDLMIGFAVWLNKGGGRFENVQTISPGPATALELVDIDGDGDLDMLAAGLDRTTGRADLFLFMNMIRRR